MAWPVAGSVGIVLDWLKSPSRSRSSADSGAMASDAEFEAPLQRLRARLEELKRQFPTGLDYKVTLDTSLFTLNSIDKVVHTFFEGSSAKVVASLLGGDAAFVPLARDTWPCSHETVVRWVKDG